MVLLFVNTFFYSVGFSLQFVDGLLCCAKAFKLIRSNFCFGFLCLRRQIKKILLQFMSRMFCLHVLLRLLCFLGLYLGLSSIFELIFVCDVGKCSNFVHLQVAVRFPQYHLKKEIAFSPLYILNSFVKP